MRFNNIFEPDYEPRFSFGIFMGFLLLKVGGNDMKMKKRRRR